MTCGGSGLRQRKRSCIPGTANPGSQDVTCLGNSFERDETCGSDLPCPDPHCPDGYQYSKEYVLIRAVVRFSNVGVRIVVLADSNRLSISLSVQGYTPCFCSLF